MATGNRSGQDWALTVSPRYCSSTPAVDDTELGLFVAFVDESVGEVTVVARDAGGNEVARDEVVVGPPAINPTTSGPA